MNTQLLFLRDYSGLFDGGGQEPQQKKLEDYLHFYLGCKVKHAAFTKPLKLKSVGVNGGTISGLDFGEIHFDLRAKNIKPLLRPLSSMTEEEMKECGNMIYDYSNDPDLNIWEWRDFEIGLAPEQYHWLLSKGFDLFGLIEAGLAIDSSKVNS